MENVDDFSHRFEMPVLCKSSSTQDNLENHAYYMHKIYVCRTVYYVCA